MAPPRRSNAILDDPDVLRDAYRTASLAEIADRIGVSTATVRRALIRHGIDRLPRNRNRRPPSARVLDDPAWLRERYRTQTAVQIATEPGVASRTVYAAMARHGIERRTEPGALKLRRPQLSDTGWLGSAVDRGSSRAVAAELEVSAGTVTTAYERAGIDPASSTRFYERGHKKRRPAADELRAAWHAEGTLRGVGQRFGIASTTAAVWLAEVDVFINPTPALPHSYLVSAIRNRWPITRIAAQHAVSVVTVKVELHRHGLFVSHRHRHRVVDGA